MFCSPVSAILLQFSGPNLFMSFLVRDKKEGQFNSTVLSNYLYARGTPTCKKKAASGQAHHRHHKLQSDIACRALVSYSVTLLKDIVEVAIPIVMT